MFRPRTPSYRLHKASGQAIVEINGHRTYLGKYGTESSQARYRRLVAEWLASPVTATRSSTTVGSISINEMLLAYWKFAQSYYQHNGTPTKELVSMREALRPVQELYGLAPATEFGPLALKAIRQTMIARGLARGVINNRVNRIKRAFKWAVSEELVPSAVYEALRTVAGLKRGRSAARETEPVKPVDRAHVEPVLPHVAPQVAAMIQLQLSTGMRPGEVVIVRPMDIDQTGPVWLYRPSDHKTSYRGHERVVFLGPQAQGILRPFLQRAADTFCFSPIEAEAERNRQRREERESPMTPSQARRKPKSNPKRPKKDRYDVHSYRRAIEYGIKKTGVPRWHPHQLRHTRATEIRREFGLDVAQIVLGHRSAAITEVYAEVDRNRAVEVIHRIG